MGSFVFNLCLLRLRGGLFRFALRRKGFEISDSWKRIVGRFYWTIVKRKE